MLNHDTPTVVIPSEYKCRTLVQTTWTSHTTSLQRRPYVHHSSRGMDKGGDWCLSWDVSALCIAARVQGPRGGHRYRPRVSDKLTSPHSITLTHPKIELSTPISPNKLDTHFKHRQINISQNCGREKTTHQIIPCLTSAAMPYDTFRCRLITSFEALIFHSIPVLLMTTTPAQPVLHGPQRIPFPVLKNTYRPQGLPSPSTYLTPNTYPTPSTYPDTSAQPVTHGSQRITFPSGTTSFTDHTSTTNRALRAVT